MRIAGQPDPRYVRLRRRLLGAIGPPIVVAAGAVTIVALADGWRTALLSAAAAAAMAGTGIRFSREAAVCLLAAVALIALGGWGPGFESRLGGRAPEAAERNADLHGKEADRHVR